MWADRVCVVRRIGPSGCRGGAKGLGAGFVAFRDGFAHSHAHVEEVGLDGRGQGWA